MLVPQEQGVAKRETQGRAALVEQCQVVRRKGTRQTGPHSRRPGPESTDCVDVGEARESVSTGWKTVSRALMEVHPEPRRWMKSAHATRCGRARGRAHDHGRGAVRRRAARDRGRRHEYVHGIEASVRRCLCTRSASLLQPVVSPSPGPELPANLRSDS